MVIATRDIARNHIWPETAAGGLSSRTGIRLESAARWKSVPVARVRYEPAKRAADIILALAFLVAFAPLFVVLALLVKLTSPGPIIFRQERVGRGGKPFTFYKFRSMYADAEARRAELLHMNEATGPVFKIKNDPRITPIGQILRRYSLDEFPQFFNVLIGDMSIVGPRPPLPCEVEKYSVRERRRLSVTPGLTCLWQISGRSNVEFDEWMELDLKYIRTMTFAGDLAILAKTIPAVLTARGAH